MLLYYAGHGVETHGENYLAPVDANPAGGGGAMNSIRVLYSNGAGVPRNERIARQWCLKAAAPGNHEAKLK